MKHTHRIATAVLVMTASLLGACSTQQDELQAWMDQERANAPRKNTKVSEPKSFEPFRYEARADIDPFSIGKLDAALAKFAARSGSGIAPDMNRRREALEAFALDSIRMVGQMKRVSSGHVALLEVEKTVYQAKVGNYLGQNYGRVTSISETEVKVKEMVQDAAGDWIERETSLQLQEAPTK